MELSSQIQALLHLYTRKVPDILGSGRSLGAAIRGKGKGKGKVRPRTGHEGSTLSLTSALDEMGVKATPRPLYPREIPGTHCIGGWVGPRAGLDGCGKSPPPHRDSIPGQSSP
jgi:hypothetical protein